MSVLIDKVVEEERLYSHMQQYGDKYFIAKPLPYYSIISIGRIKDAFRILRGKSMAIHYKEDE